jgi:hypothetical protein
MRHHTPQEEAESRREANAARSQRWTKALGYDPQQVAINLLTEQARAEFEHADRQIDAGEWSDAHRPDASAADEAAYRAILDARTTAWRFVGLARAHRLEGHETAARRYLNAAATWRRKGY